MHNGMNKLKIIKIIVNNNDYGNDKYITDEVTRNKTFHVPV
jgi:hypothetical protein